ncbi:nicotinate-nucleotide adenylyltransferase [Tepidanaerobacter acetatoxydans]|uniref:nicotinate-nucleotide adenylyltransferase n=1 Tax=Tepidanaerobacter acetatoxydans TaxID=499229 RepID=UPI001BD5CD03|nr:nicotinate-nucleotide adenylyltransferase [Tepidanaerobacter acetatoxydans]
MSNNEKVGIMGGTFDPIHYGHLVTAETARTNFKLDRVIFTPAGRPPHKKGYAVTSSEDRYLMTMLAINNNPFFEISRMEIERPGLTYTVDTLEKFYNDLGKNVKLYFISGADAVFDILTWKDVDKVLSYCTFIAATRPGYPMEQLNQKLMQIRQIYGHQVVPMKVTSLDISSTEIRRRVKEGLSIKYLLPESVETYIRKSGLYR